MIHPDFTDVTLKTIKLSSRQYAVLKMFASSDDGITVEEALNIDQRSFGSIFSPSRQYIVWDERLKRFRLSMKGRQAIGIFETTVVTKTDGHYLSRYIRTVRALAEYQKVKSGEQTHAGFTARRFTNHSQKSADYRRAHRK